MTMREMRSCLMEMKMFVDEMEIKMLDTLEKIYELENKLADYELQNYEV